MMRRCDKCVYWVVQEYGQKDRHEDDWEGDCHRHAPHPVNSTLAYEILRHLTILSWAAKPNKEEFDSWESAPEGNANWPITIGSDWCGDFLKRAVISDVP